MDLTVSGRILSDTTASDLARDIAEALEECEAHEVTRILQLFDNAIFKVLLKGVCHEIFDLHFFS